MSSLPIFHTAFRAVAAVLIVTFAIAGAAEAKARRKFAYDVAIVEFKNSSGREVDDQIRKGIHQEFVDHGLRVAPRTLVSDEVQRLELDTDYLSAKNRQRLALAVSARYLVTGEIKQFRSNKKVNVPGLILSPVTSAAVTYGTVEIYSEIHDAVRGKTIWDQNSKETKKRRILGAYRKKRNVENQALADVLDKLYQTFFDSL